MPFPPASATVAWKRLGAAHRRRIVLGGLLGVAIAARDLMLLAVAAGLLALSEMDPTRAPAARPT